MKEQLEALINQAEDLVKNEKGDSHLKGSLEASIQGAKLALKSEDTHEMTFYMRELHRDVRALTQIINSLT